MVISPVTIGLASSPTEPAVSAENAVRAENAVPAETAGGCGCGGCGCGGAGAGQAAEPGETVLASGATTAYSVEGMTCGHCVGAVTQELAAVAGVTDVDVQLVVGGRSTVTVSSVEPLDVVDVRAAIDEAGYTLVGQD